MITYHNACCTKQGAYVYHTDGTVYVVLEKCIVDYSNPGWFQLQIRSVRKIGDTGYDYMFITPSNASTFSLKDSKHETTNRRVSRLSSSTNTVKKGTKETT